jgi:hypothetical protein
VPTHSPFNAVLPLKVKGRTSCWPIASIYCQDYECVKHYYPVSPCIFMVLNHRNNFILVLSSKICQEFHHAADALPVSLPTHTRIRAVQQRNHTQINQPTRCINLSDLLLVVQIQLNMFRASSCPSSGAYKLQ